MHDGHWHRVLKSKYLPFVYVERCLVVVDPPPVTSLTLYPLSPVAMCHLLILPLWPAWPPLPSVTHLLPATHPHLPTSTSRLGVVPARTPLYMACRHPSLISPSLPSSSSTCSSTSLLPPYPMTVIQARQLFQMAA
jgi:hypothetical protein